MTAEENPKRRPMASPQGESPKLKASSASDETSEQDDDITLCADNVDLANVPRKPDALIGTVIAEHFRIDSRLAEGGMSAVYKAKDLLLGRDVAIKVLLPGRQFTEESLLRFQREAKAVGILNHPNIVRVYEMNTFARGEPFIAMEFVDGATLSSKVKGTNGLPELMTITVMQQCANALSYAHSQGIIHRDIKSGNIMISEGVGGEWQAKLVDFGIARALEEDAINLTRTGEVFGSPRYMSPEQCQGEKIDARSDIYSLGCVIYECLTGDVPFKGLSALDTMRMHTESEVVPPSHVRKGLHLSAELDRIVLKCLAKDRGHRYQTAQALEQDLAAVSQLEKSGMGSRIMSGFRKLPKFGKGKKSFQRRAALAYILGSAGLLAWIGYSQGHILFDKLYADCDYAGQKAFDVGDYKKANDSFLTGLKIAEILPVNMQSVKVAYMLSELVELTSANGDDLAHKEWLSKKAAAAKKVQGDINDFRGQQIKLCNDSLKKFIAEAKAANGNVDDKELQNSATQVLERFNDMVTVLETDDSMTMASPLLEKAFDATIPYLDPTNEVVVIAKVNRAWLAYFANSPSTRQLLLDAEAALRSARKMSSTVRARNFTRLSQVNIILGNRDAARTASEEALSAVRASGDMQSDVGVMALLIRALLENETRHIEAADFYYNQAKFELSQKNKAYSPSAHMLFTQVTLMILGSRPPSLHNLELSKNILDREEKNPTNKRLLTRALLSAGTISGWIGRGKEFVFLLERAAAIGENNDDVNAAGTALDMIGEAYASHNMLPQSIPYFVRAREIYGKHRENYSNSFVATSNNLALLYMKQNNFDAAGTVLKEAEEVVDFPSFGAPKFKQILLERLGTIAERKGDMPEARAYKKKLDRFLEEARRAQQKFQTEQQSQPLTREQQNSKT